MSLQTRISVLDNWQQVFDAAPSWVGTHDPYERQKSHARIGKEYLKIAFQFGASLIERNVKTGHSHGNFPMTVAVFMIDHAHLPAFRAEVAQLVDRIRTLHGTPA